MEGGVGHMGGLTNPAPGAEDAEPVILIPVGLKRGRLLKKDYARCKQLYNSPLFYMRRHLN